MGEIQVSIILILIHDLVVMTQVIETQLHQLVWRALLQQQENQEG